MEDDARFFILMHQRALEVWILDSPAHIFIGNGQFSGDSASFILLESWDQYTYEMRVAEL